MGNTATSGAVDEHAVGAAISASAPPSRRRSRRADAKRNHERLVAAARTVFAEVGPDAALEHIARQAGVGPGTLYRHFPTRMDLVDAVLRDRLDTLIAAARDLATASCPVEALATWLRAVIAHSMGYRGLAAWQLAQHLDQATGRTASAHQAVRAAGSLLLGRAQRMGKVRPDVTATEMLRLVNAIALATEQFGEGLAHAERLLQIVIDGLQVCGQPAEAGITPGRMTPKERGTNPDMPWSTWLCSSCMPSACPGAAGYGQRTRGLRRVPPDRPSPTGSVITSRLTGLRWPRSRISQAAIAATLRFCCPPLREAHPCRHRVSSVPRRRPWRASGTLARRNLVSSPGSNWHAGQFLLCLRLPQELCEHSRPRRRTAGRGRPCCT